MVFRRNRTNRIYMCVYIRRDLLGELTHMAMETEKSHSWAAFGQLETQERRLCNSLWVQRPKNLGKQWLDFVSHSLSLKAQEPGPLKFKDRRQGMSQLKETEWIFSPSCTILFYSGSQQIRWCQLALSRASFFTQSTDSKANLFLGHPPRRIQK